MKLFTDRLNISRVKDGYKKLPYRAIAVKLSDACPSLQDMHYLWKRCDEADNFSRCFWGSLKVRDYPATKSTGNELSH